MNKVRDIVEKNQSLKIRLFSMGFYASNVQRTDISGFPFYGKWNVFQLDDMFFYVHPSQRFYSIDTEKRKIALIGHAYHPQKMIALENDVLKMLVSLSGENFFQEICMLTGVFTMIIKENGLWRLLGDATGMQTNFYTMKNDEIHVSSHTNLLRELLHLQVDDYVKKLSNYRFFRLFGNSLPGDISPFAQVKRIVPNHYVEFAHSPSVIRFHTPEIKNIPRQQLIEQVGELLHNNLQLIAEKWKKPAISLTGGCDSKTTLACANGLYDSFTYFSYISSKEEEADAIAAQQICKFVGGGRTIQFTKFPKCKKIA